MIVIVLAWIYVLAMMALALAVEPGGSMLRAIVGFLIVGFGPPALLLYLWGMRRRRQLRRESLAFEPDGGSVPPADAIAPERKET